MSTYSKDDALRELSAMGSESMKNILLKHGAREPLFGVKIADMKKLVKKVKKDHPLSIELFATGNYDAMYLAGLIADEKKISEKELRTWAQKAYAGISDYTVPWIASESPHGWKLGMEWIESSQESIAAEGWMTLGNVVTLLPDDKLSMDAIKSLMARVKKEIGSATSRERVAMNMFLISVGGYVAPLTQHAKEVAKSIGPAAATFEDTARKLPNALDYISKMEKMGRIGKKKKQARC